MNIYCIGDSITFGYGLTRLSQRWTDIAAARTGHTLVNCGISGDTTGGMLARCQWQIWPKKPDLMIFLGGINDINLTNQYRPCCANVAAIVHQAAAYGIPMMLGLPLPIVPEDFPFLSWDNHLDLKGNVFRCEEYAQWLREYANYKDLPCIDFRSPFFDKDGKVIRELFQDGLHPTAEGHALMADALCEVLDQYC